jgi:hypothetical protein
MMHAKRIVLALVVTFASGVCLAQSSDEFGRATGGLLELSVKGPTRFSGSLGLTSGSGLRGYGATFGGTVVNDRLWFFGAAERNQSRIVSSTIPQTSPRFDANWNAALGARNSFSASYRSATIPSSSFMTLHYTGIVSSNMFITGSVSRTP